MDTEYFFPKMSFFSFSKRIFLLNCHFAKFLEFLYFFSAVHPLQSAILYFELGFFAEIIAGALYFANDARLLNAARKTAQNAGIIFVWIFFHLYYRFCHPITLS